MHGESEQCIGGVSYLVTYVYFLSLFPYIYKYIYIIKPLQVQVSL